MAKEYFLIYVGVSENSNKFWKSSVDGCTVHRSWGRVGGKGQKKDFHYSSEAEAERATDKKANDKLRKGYQHASLLLSSGTAKVGNLDLRTVALNQIKTNGDKTLTDLVKFLVDTNVHTITTNTNITFKGGQLHTALGVITPDAIRKARKLLNQIVGFVKRDLQDTPQFDRLVEQYLILVPTKIGRKLVSRDVFPNDRAVEKQSAILDAMDAVTVVSDPDSKTFSVKLSKSTSDEKGNVVKLFHKTQVRGHRSYGMKVKAVYRVVIESDDGEFDDSVGNVQQLWHGTKASNLLAIFKKGLIIVPSGASHTTGRMFGDGLYFSDQSTKALNYATTFWGGRDEGRYFMLLCDVAMGRAYTPNGGVSRPPSGYDSIFAKARVSGVQNNEHIIQSEQRARIKYLVEFQK